MVRRFLFSKRKEVLIVGTALTMVMLCAVIFFIIFAAKSKDHFQEKPFPDLSIEDEDDTRCLCDNTPAK